MTRILVIDDDAASRAAISATLRDAGFEVVEAANGAEGLAAHVAQRTDLVITDMVMPEKDGIETIRALREHAPAPPIIGISGSTHGDLYLKISRLSGACETLTKPFASGALLAAVNRALNQAAPATSAPPPRRLLIVDDDPNGRYLTVHRIRREFPQVEIVEAEQATAALELMRETKVDILVTDNGLGPKDGITMIRELRDHAFGKPIIMSSLNPLLERKALDAGANAFVYGGDANTLMRLLRQYLE